MQNLDKDYGIKGRPLSLPLDRISEDDERGAFDLPLLPSQKDKFDSARSSTSPNFSKALHPGLRNLSSALQGVGEGIKTDTSSKSARDSSGSASPTNDAKSINEFTTQSNDADDEDSLEQPLPSNGKGPGRSSYPPSFPSSIEVDKTEPRHSLDSATTYHTARTGRHFASVEDCSDGESVFSDPSPIPTAGHFDLADRDLIRRLSSLKRSEVRTLDRDASIPGRDQISSERLVIVEERRSTQPTRPLKAALPKTDSEKASPKSEEAVRSRIDRRYWHTLPWVISWLTIVVLLCLFIGQNYRPLSTPKLLEKHQSKTKRLFEEDATLWRTFSHNETFIFNVRLPKSGESNVPIANRSESSRESLAARDSVPAIVLRVHNNDTWDPVLWVEHVGMLNSSWASFNTKLAVEHKVNLTAVCPHPSEIEAGNPTTSFSSTSPTTSTKAVETTISTSPDSSLPSLSLQTPITSTRSARPTITATAKPSSRIPQLREPRSVTYAKNLLTCLWFLPLWLLAVVIAEKYHMKWLAPEEGRVRSQITAVIVSLTMAAALALATEELVKAIVDSIYGA